MKALFTSASGMNSQQLAIDVLSHNVANLNTTGYKRRRVEFQDLTYQNYRQVGSASSDNNTIVPVGVQVGIGVKAAGVYRISEQGSLTATRNQLDMAITGKGFFRITLPDGDTAYTRAGSFQVDAQGRVVNVDGYPLQPAITIPSDFTSINITPSGQISATIGNAIAEQVLGQIDLATFINQAGLEAIGDNLFKETTASGQAQVNVPGTNGTGVVRQGHLETSNVSVIDEITTMIFAQRAYEMNSKVTTTADRMYGTLVQIR